MANADLDGKSARGFTKGRHRSSRALSSLAHPLMINKTNEEKGHRAPPAGPTLKGLAVCAILTGIGVGGVEIYARIARQNYIPKESSLLSSDISIDSVVQSWNPDANFQLIARNLSGRSISGEVVFEIELDPSFLDVEALRKSLDEVKSDKAELITLLKEKLNNPENHTSRELKIIDYIDGVLQGRIARDVPVNKKYQILQIADENIEKYNFRCKRYLALGPLEVASVNLSSSVPPGFKYSKPTISAVAVLK